ncbi:MAG: hypothetical protein AAGF04_01335 [Chlamydiota bacterium]
MKKFATLCMVLSMMLCSIPAHADMGKHGYKYNGKSTKGVAAMDSSDNVFDMAWPVAIGTLAILVTIATLAATSATDRSPTFSEPSAS